MNDSDKGMGFVGVIVALVGAWLILGGLYEPAMESSGCTGRAVLSLSMLQDVWPLAVLLLCIGSWLGGDEK